MKPIASLSLDLDNQWSYMKTHGDADWERYPSYLDVMIPRVLDFFHARDTRITFFIVGRDATLDKNAEPLAELGASAHEIGNHSFHHEPWLHRYTPQQVDEEISRAEESICEATGRRPNAFRGPGFSLSRSVLETLVRRNYRYDASTFPTFIGPIARAYYFMKTDLSEAQRDERKDLFGSPRDGLRPLKPYQWDLGADKLLEIPVTTMPLLRAPFHLSYVLYLSTYSQVLARRYFRAALKACRAASVEPSILLHPLDFLGADDVDALSFFPGMTMLGAEKRERMSEYLEQLGELFDVLPLGEHAARLQARPLPLRRVDLPS